MPQTADTVRLKPDTTFCLTRARFTWVFTCVLAASLV